MKRKRLLMALGSVSVALMLALPMVAGCAAPTPTPTPTVEPGVIEWTFNVTAPPHLALGTRLQEYIDRIEERSKGGLKLNPVWGGALGVPQPQVASALGKGVFEISFNAISLMSAEIPVLGVVGLPLLFRDVPEAILGSQALLPYTRNALHQSNIKLLDNPFFYSKQALWTSRPVNKVEDLKGMSLRTSGAEMCEMLKKVEVTTHTIPAMEMYTALQRGIVDGVVTSAIGVRNITAYEVIDYGIDIAFSMCDGGIMVWEDAWEALPFEYQMILLEETNRFIANENYEAIHGEVLDWAFLIEEGMTRVTPPTQLFDDLRKLAIPFWDAWAEEKGSPSTEALAKIKELLGF